MFGLAHMFSLDCFMTGCLGPPPASPFRFSPAAGQRGSPQLFEAHGQSVCACNSSHILNTPLTHAAWAS